MRTNCLLTPLPPSQLTFKEIQGDFRARGGIGRQEVFAGLKRSDILFGRPAETGTYLAWLFFGLGKNTDHPIKMFVFTGGHGTGKPGEMQDVLLESTVLHDEKNNVCFLEKNHVQCRRERNNAHEQIL